MKQCLCRSLIVSFAAVALLARADALPTNAVTIDALVEDALTNNPELIFYRAEIAAAKGQRRSAGTIANPEAEFELGHKRAHDRSGSLAGEGVAWSVGVSQTFEYPNRLALRKAIANGQVELAELGLEHFKQTLAARVRLLGYKRLVAQEKERAAKSVAQRGQELIEVLVQRDAAGTTPLLETRIIEADVLSLKRRANQAAKEAQTALLELNQLRGAPVSTPLTIASTKLKFPPIHNTEEIFAARTNNFELKSRVKELEQQGLQVSLSKNERYPAFTVRPFYSEENAGETERVVGVGLSLPLPLWNRNRGNIETARAREEQAETTLMLTQRRIERELHKNLSNYEVQRKEIATWRPNIVEQLEQSAELADRHYRLGALPVSTYLEMQEKYLEGLDAILDIQQEALESRQEIEQLIGSSLTAEQNKKAR